MHVDRQRARVTFRCGDPSVVDIDGGVVDDGVDVADRLHLVGHITRLGPAGEIADDQFRASGGEVVERGGRAHGCVRGR